MKRFAINEVSTFGWNFAEDVARYHAHGVHNIGVWRHKLGDYSDDAAANLLCDHQLRVSSLHWAGGFTGNDGMSFHDAIEDGIAAIRTASLIDAGCLIVHPGSRRGHTHAHARRLLDSALSELAPIARDFDVRLALEPMNGVNGRSFTFLHSIADALDVAQKYDPDELGVVFDFYHQSGPAIDRDLLGKHINRIALVQISDRKKKRHQPLQRRCALGHGVIPIREWMKFFDSHNYDGFYEIEIFGEDLVDWDEFQTLEHSVGAINVLAQLTGGKAEHRVFLPSRFEQL